MGKLSDQDYQQTKKDLQKELAAVMAEVDRVKLKARLEGQSAAAAPQPKTQAAPNGSRLASPARTAARASNRS